MARLSLSDVCRFGLMAMIGACALFSFVLMYEIGLDEGLLCLVATSALCAISFPILIRRDCQLFEPIWFVALIVAVGITGKAFYICLGPDQRVRYLLLDKEPGDLLPTALLMALGLLCLSLGYLLGNVRWRLPPLPRLEKGDWDSGRYYVVIGALVAIGLVSFVIFAQRLDVSITSLSDLSSKRFLRIPGSKYAGAQGYLRWGAMLLETAFYLVFARSAASSRKITLRTAALILLFAMLAMAFPIFVSSRRAILFMIIRVLVIWIALRGEPRPRYVVALVMAGLVVIGSMLALRRGESSWESLRAHVGVSGLMEVTIGGRQFLDLTRTAHITNAVPEFVDYQYGKTLVTWVVAPVPRSAWPEKPPMVMPFGPMLFQLPRGSLPPTFFAEMYLNFGIPGIVVGLLVLGVLLRSLFVTLQPRLKNVNFLLIYTLLSTQLAMGMLPNDVSQAMIWVLTEQIALLLALYLVAGDRRPQELGRS